MKQPSALQLKEAKQNGCGKPHLTARAEKFFKKGIDKAPFVWYTLIIKEREVRKMAKINEYFLTEEEAKAVEKLIIKMREERRKEEAIRQNTEHLENIVMATIDAIGLEETKRIIRNINRSLREVK